MGWWESQVAVPLGSSRSFSKRGQNSWTHEHSTLQSRDGLCLLTGRLSQMAGQNAHIHAHSHLGKVPNEGPKTQAVGEASAGSLGGNANEQGHRLWLWNGSMLSR